MKATGRESVSIRTRTRPSCQTTISIMKNSFLRPISGLVLGLSLSIATHAAEPPKIGEKAPDFSLKTLDDKTVRLSDLTANGKVVLIVLRGWPGYQCPICERQVQD